MFKFENVICPAVFNNTTDFNHAMHLVGVVGKTQIDAAYLFANKVFENLPELKEEFYTATVELCFHRLQVGA